MPRRPLAILLGSGLLACLSTPEPRPAALDPSNPDAPGGSPIPPLEAFATGPQGLDDTLLPPAPAMHEEGEHDHGEHEHHEAP